MILVFVTQAAHIKKALRDGELHLSVSLLSIFYASAQLAAQIIVKVLVFPVTT